MKTISIRPITVIGILIGFFGVPLVIFLFSLYAPDDYTDAFVLHKEAWIFIVTGLLLLLIIKGEKRGLHSIGLHNRHWLRSFRDSVILTIILFIALIICALILQQFDIPIGGEEAYKYESISLWTMALVTIRAGIVEEICYRGYLIERLEKISNGNKWVFLILPVVVFALFHYSQGVSGFVISFVAGLILAIAYWKKRDLKANIIAHFLVDFIPNVLLVQLL